MERRVVRVGRTAGEQDVHAHARIEPRFRTGITSVVPWLVVSDSSQLSPGDRPRTDGFFEYGAAARPAGRVGGALGELVSLAPRSMTVAFVCRVPGPAFAGRPGLGASASARALRPRPVLWPAERQCSSPPVARRRSARWIDRWNAARCSGLTLAMRTVVLAQSSTLRVVSGAIRVRERGKAASGWHIRQRQQRAVTRVRHEWRCPLDH